MRNMGLRVRSLREKRGWSQLRLSQETGISNSVISRIESNEKKTIDNKLTAKLADALEVSTDYLMGQTENPNPHDKESEFYAKLQLDLSDDDLAKQYDLIVDGKIVPTEKVAAALAVLRSLLKQG